MSISTYTELQTALTTWGHRPDLAALYPDFVSLAEAGLNRDLRVRAQETTYSATLASGAATLPTGFLGFKELRSSSSPSYTLEPRPLEWIKDQPTQASAPHYYAITGTQVVCWPQTGDIAGTYWKEIPPLATNSTNWLLTSHPDLYLAAALEQLFSYCNDDAKLAKWAGRRTAVTSQLQGADAANSIAGGPLQTRVR